MEEKKKSFRISEKKSVRKGNQYSNMIYGKVQPQAIPLEEVVLGAIMLDKDAIAIVIDILNEESFYLEAHSSIYKAVKELFKESQPVDLLTVTEKLKTQGDLDKVGGAYYLVDLTNRVASSANIEYHARIIAQKHIQRELITASTTIINEAYDDSTDVFDLLDKAEKALFKITEQNLSKSYESISTLVTRAMKQLEEVSQKEEGLTGIPTGFTDLDRLTSGWQPSDLIILAARPGMGKTSFVLSLARNAALDFGKPVALFSLEMSSVQLTMRIISAEAGIEGSKLRNGQLEDDEWKRLAVAAEKIASAKIIIDDTPALNIYELRAKCRRMKMQSDIQMIIIDYLQLMQGSGDGNREQEVSMISRSLKGLAKELEVPVIALSQLNRSVETRGGSKKPLLSDLRESGSIEQDADIVSFIYRPEYYKITEDEEGRSLKGVAEVIIAKHRNGALDTVKLKFIDKYAKFEDLTDVSFFDGYGDGNLSNDNAYDNIITRSSKLNEDDNVPF